MMKSGFGRLLAGFLIAPAVPAALMFVVQVFTIGFKDAADGAFVLLVIGYGSAMILGIPSYLFLRSKGLNGLGSYLAAGSIIGIAYFCLIFIPTYLNADSKYVGELVKNTIWLGVIGLGGGLIASFVFWCIAIRPHGRPVIG